MTPDEAQRFMGAMAAAFMGVGKVLPASLRLFFPLKNIIHPIRLSPVYFPAWVINAEIHADVTQEDDTVGLFEATLWNRI